MGNKIFIVTLLLVGLLVLLMVAFVRPFSTPKGMALPSSVDLIPKSSEAKTLEVKFFEKTYLVKVPSSQQKLDVYKDEALGTYNLGFDVNIVHPEIMEISIEPVTQSCQGYKLKDFRERLCFNFIPKPENGYRSNGDVYAGLAVIDGQTHAFKVVSQSYPDFSFDLLKTMITAKH